MLEERLTCWQTGLTALAEFVRERRVEMALERCFELQHDYVFIDSFVLLHQQRELSEQIKPQAATFYAIFMCCLLAKREFPEARFLYQRIPEKIIELNGGFLKELWRVGSKLMSGSFIEAVKLLNKLQGPADSAECFQLFKDAMAEQCLEFIEDFYKTVQVSTLQELGFQDPSALIQARGWTLSDNGAIAVLQARPKAKRDVSYVPVEKLIGAIALLEN